MIKYNKSGTCTLTANITQMEFLVNSASEILGCWDPDDEFTYQMERYTDKLKEQMLVIKAECDERAKAAV